MGTVAEKFLILVTSDAWKSDFILLGKGNIPIIENIGDGLLALMDMFRDLTVIVQPFLEALSEGFKNGSENLKRITGEARKTGSLGKWLMGDGESRGVLDTLGQWRVGKSHTLHIPRRSYVLDVAETCTVGDIYLLEVDCIVDRCLELIWL